MITKAEAAALYDKPFDDWAANVIAERLPHLNETTAMGLQGYEASDCVFELCAAIYAQPDAFSEQVIEAYASHAAQYPPDDPYRHWASNLKKFWRDANAPTP